MFTYPVCHFSITDFSPFTFEIQNSCVFNDNDSDYLNRTFVSPTDANIFTISLWVKRSNLGTDQAILSDTAPTDPFEFGFLADDTFTIRRSGTFEKTTSQVFKDPSAWYHIIASYNSDEATADDRVKLYVNGTQITNFSFSSNPGLGSNAGAFNTARAHEIGRLRASLTRHSDGYMADFIFVDGQALEPTAFGSFEVSTGLWIPVNYSGTYGNNGFRLDFSDSADLGNDISGNNNDWTENSIVAANQTTDTPTQNYMVMPGNFPFSTTDISNGGLVVGSTSNSNAGIVYGSFPLESGKWYWEVDITSTTIVGGLGTYPGIGCIRIPFDKNITSSAGSNGQFPGRASTDPDGFSIDGAGDLNDFGTNNPSFFDPFTQSDIISIALDLDNGNVWFGKNNTWLGGGSPDPATGTSPAISSITGQFIPAMSVFTTTRDYEFNFGQRDFTYTPPAGFRAVSTANISQPKVRVPTSYFDSISYAGNGISPRNVTGFDFTPDFVWIKSRNFANNNHLSDSVRGVNSTLFPDDQSVALVDNDEGYVTAFNSNGFQVTAGSLNDDEVNDSVTNYLTWCLRSDSISGFDIVTYTGTGVNRTVSHGLGVVPEMIIVKSTTSAQNFVMYHRSLGSSDGTSPANHTIALNLSNDRVTSSTYWNNTLPTATEFTVGTNATVNSNGATYIAYVFTGVPGFSKFDHYIGNGFAEGPLISTGFRPKHIFGKRLSGTTTNWFMKSQALTPGYNTFNTLLYPSSTLAESTDGEMDFLAQGMKVRSSGDPNTNVSGDTYIYAAFAEYPGKWSGAV